MKSNGRSFLRLRHIAGFGAIGSLIVAGRLLIGSAPPKVAVPEPVELQQVAIPADFGGTERYLTHVTTDKPIYRTGEKVYVRGVTLRADGHTPSAQTYQQTFYEIKGPKGDVVTSGAAQMSDSVVGFAWEIPESQPGGEYAVHIFHPTGDPPAVRKFDIRAYRAPRLKSQIVFVRDGYGPGDTVGANLHIERAEGGIPAGAKVSVTARVDGAETWTGATTVDASGNATATFKLPSAIARGEGVIAMVIEDGGAVETATKTIPILLQTLDLGIYPEGGDLVAGLPTRVYVEGRTPVQKPADMAGIVVTSAGKQVANFRTEHEGRGRFAFTPEMGESYALRITEPAGIKTVFNLPAVKASGVVIAAPADVTAKQRDVILRVAAASEGAYSVTLSQRGKEVAFKSLALKSGQPADLAFSLPRSVDGVLVATVYDDRKTPLAERLIFRQPEHDLKVRVTADREDYVPGDKVTLRVVTTDETGKPMAAVVGLTVTDSSVLEMIEKREQAPRLPVMALLENDVKDLADAHVYLDETNPKAPLATALLLGTQGWRRFAAVDAARFVASHSDAARRVLGLRMLTDADRARTAALRNRRIEFLEEAFLFEADGGGGIPDGVPGGQIGGRPKPAAPPPPAGRAAPPAAPAPRAQAAAAQPKEMEIPARIPRDDERKKREDQKMAEMPANRPRAAMEQAQLADMAFDVRQTVRVYAHSLRPGWTEGSRSDFAETVYWNAGVKTDATGAASVTFNLSDSVTAFHVLADGYAQNGALGSSVSHVESVRPFSIEPKLPLQVTTGDVIQLPVGLINGMSRELRGGEITVTGTPGIKFTMMGQSSAALRAKERGRQLVQIDSGAFSGIVSLTLDAKAGPYRDTVERKIEVRPQGFPHEDSKGGMLERNGAVTFEFTLPQQIVRGSLASTATVYPTPLASMTDALQSLLQQPNGCFEQTSSTSYPLVMAQQYFLTHTGVDPAVIQRAKDLLENSYMRLTGFESRTKGYEWFGADPGHEALTAYGLMQFTDMAQVRAVDKEMLDRTRGWLLARRDGKGGFSVNPKALDSFGHAPADTTNAYITWALIESGEKGLDKELAGVKASAGATADSYIMALGANILHATGDFAGARPLMEKLVQNQQANGSVKGAGTSITRSGGDALAIETTALSVLAWMRDPSFAAQVEKGLRWIVESNKSGRFGSTQSTILALRAIIAYDAAHARPKAPGRVLLTVDGNATGVPLPFTADTKGALVLPEFVSELGPGKHTVALKMENGSDMPFSLNVKYYSVLPDNSERSQVAIEVALKDRQIREGGVTEAVASVTNKSGEAIPTPVAIVGIPGGLEVRHDQLKELVRSGKIDAYEVLGREVVLYWRYIKAKDKFDIPLSLVAAVPGTYTGPASRAYLYYTDEYKTWSPGLKVSITPR